MAYPIPHQQGMTQEQAEVLRELNSFLEVSKSNAWKELKAKMQEMVDEAQEELFGCHPLTGAEKRGILSIRWQQRRAMYLGLVQFLDSQLNEREKMLEELKEQNVNDTDDSRTTGSPTN